MSGAGHEARQARSPLRLRLALVIFGLLMGLASIVVTARAGIVPGEIVAVLFTVGVVIDLAVVVHRLRHDGGAARTEPLPPPAALQVGPSRPKITARATTERGRMRHSLAVVVLFLVLLAVDWLALGGVSKTGAVMVTLALLVLPLGAMVVASGGAVTAPGQTLPTPHADGPPLGAEGPTPQTDRPLMRPRGRRP